MITLTYEFLFLPSVDRPKKMINCSSVYKNSYVQKSAYRIVYWWSCLMPCQVSLYSKKNNQDNTGCLVSWLSINVLWQWIPIQCLAIYLFSCIWILLIIDHWPSFSIFYSLFRYILLAVLVLAVIGDNFGDTVNQEAIMNQLRAKLGIKVVVQMENAEGNVVFEDTVTPNNVTGNPHEISNIFKCNKHTKLQVTFPLPQRWHWGKKSFGWTQSKTPILKLGLFQFFCRKCSSCQLWVYLHTSMPLDFLSYWSLIQKLPTFNNLMKEIDHPGLLDMTRLDIASHGYKHGSRICINVLTLWCK